MNTQPPPDSEAIRAAEILDQILELISDAHMAHQIDARIDGALDNFQFEPKETFTHHQFHQAISTFVFHVYKFGLQIPQDLKPDDAGAEAVHILEKSYQGTHADGYDAAYLDAQAHGKNEIQVVLLRMTEAIKAIERQKHINWVFAEHVDSRDWETRCQMVQILRERWLLMLAPQLQQRPQAELAHDIRNIVLAVQNSQALLRRITSGASPLHSPETDPLNPPQ